MTGVILAARGPAAYLATDAGCFYADGRMMGLRRKVMAIDRLAAAISVSGTSLIDHDNELNGWLSGIPSQAALVMRLPELAECYQNEITKADFGESGPLPRFVQFYIAMHCRETDEGRAYIIGSAPGTFGSSYEPGTVRRIGTMFQPPLSGDPFPAHTFDPTTNAAEAMQLARHEPFDDNTYRVGGWADMATVTASGVKIDRLCTWHDKPGRLIQPKRKRPLGAWLSMFSAGHCAGG